MVARIVIYALLGFFFAPAVLATRGFSGVLGLTVMFFLILSWRLAVIIRRRGRATTLVTETGVSVVWAGNTDEMAADDIVRVEAIRAEDTPVPRGRVGRFEADGDVAVFMGKTSAVGIEDRHGRKLIIGTERPLELVSAVEGLT